MPSRTRPSKRAAGAPIYTITCEWDDEACVWYVAESDVPGLATEAATIEQLEAKLATMIPELVELNVPGADATHVPFKLVATKQTFARSA
jgi:predicted RNase H-like HicB family nuclease